MKNVLVVLVMAILLFSYMHAAVSAPSPLATPILRFDPAAIELGPANCINNTFALKAKIENVEDLGSIGLRVEWNTTYFDYVDHIIKAPVEVYPDGVLHEPMLIVADIVDATGGSYDFAVASYYPASGFYGDGIAFEITYKVKYQPLEYEPEVNTSVDFLYDELMDSSSSIPHFTENCSIIILPCWNVADVNDDLKVDIFDVVLGVNAYQATPSDPHWNPRCDLADPYGVIDILDIMTIVASYGEEYVS